MTEKLEYRGRMQPDRWKLHPEDFAARMAWEDERQRILDAQVEAIEQGLPDPTEKIPPIPELKHPGYHLRLRTVTSAVTEAPTVTRTVTKVCAVCGKPIAGKAVYCSDVCRQRFHRSK
jgi:hypothetical protein